VRNVDLNSNSSNPKHLTVVGDEILYFTANDGVHGTELWKSNGTSIGTEIHLDISEGANSSNPKHLIEFSNNLYFVAHNGSENVVMTTVGYENTTIWFANTLGVNITNPSAGAIFSNSLYFTADEGLFQIVLISIHPGANPIPFVGPVDLHAWNGAPEILVATDNEIDSENILFLTNNVNNNRYLFYHWDNSYSSLHYV
jgi:ELWxxDGT repeat protein